MIFDIEQHGEFIYFNVDCCSVLSFCISDLNYISNNFYFMLSTSVFKRNNFEIISCRNSESCYRIIVSGIDNI